MEVNILNWIFNWSSIAVVTALVALVGKTIERSRVERAMKAVRIASARR